MHDITQSEECALSEKKEEEAKTWLDITADGMINSILISEQTVTINKVMFQLIVPLV